MTGYQNAVVSLTVKQDTPARRFVKPDGTLGGSMFISLADANSGSACPVLAVGSTEVEAADGQIFAANDNVASDAEGKAVKISDVRATPVTACCAALAPAVNGVLKVFIK